MARGWALITVFSVLLITEYTDADVVVHTNGYASYTQKLLSTKTNHFQFQFKTKDHTGVLMHAKGGSDFITLELIKGKLRYAADYGQTYDSYGEVASGFHEMFVGQRLANNEWHVVDLIHNEEKHKVTIKISNLNETEYETSRKIQQYDVKFSVEHVHTGGMKFIELTSPKESLAKKGIDGCFRNAVYNGKSVIDGAHVTLINAKRAACPLQAFFTLTDFAFRTSFLSYNFTGSQVKVSFVFKTRQVDQVLFDARSSVIPKINIAINKVGRVFGQFGDKNLSSEVSGTHDGYWHSVEFSWSSVPRLMLKVDGKTASMETGIRFPSVDSVEKFFFGKEFQGCMADFVVNGKKLVPSDFDKYGSKWEPTFGNCAQNEFCVPNPCLHGGKCKELPGKDVLQDTFQCNCTNTGYSGSVCNKPFHSASCAAIRAGPSNNAVSGKHFIDVDGMGPLPKVEVECYFKSQSVETVVKTKLASEVPVEDISGQKRVNIPYTADKRSIRSITMQSQQCSQHVKYVCTKSALFQSPKGPPQVRWLGPNYNFHYYWGGSNGKTDHCRCGVYNNCTDPSKYCNCDARSGKEATDEGALTNKKHLPMSRIEFLDVTSWKGSKGRFSIGSLKCSGDVSKDNAVSFRDSMAYLKVKPTSVTDYNNAIDAMTVAFSFKTTKAQGVIFYGKGPTSMDYIQVKIQSQSRIRAEVNMGSKADVVDLKVNGKFDDNKSHSVFFEFNRKELTFTVDGKTDSFKRDPSSLSHLDLDGEAFFVGGGHGVSEGFIGCVSGLFINGLMIDMQSTARYKEQNGVHVGCGIGCTRPGIVPCNYGKCIEKYSTFTCDCSLSPFDGKYCHKESYAINFNKGTSLMFTFKAPLQIKEGEAIVAFKTDHQNALIFSIHGDKLNCHLSLVLINGNLRVVFNFDTSSTSMKFFDVQPALQKSRFDDGKLHIVRVTHNGKKVAMHLLGEMSTMVIKNLEAGDDLLTGVKISIGSVKPPLSPQSGVPNSFIGCMSSFKYKYLPNMAQKPIILDIFALYGTGSKDVGGDGKIGPCSKSLPTPPPLPILIGRPTSTTRPVRPMQRMTVVRDYSLLIILLACVIVLFLLIVLVILCKYINRNLGAYKTNEDKRPLSRDTETAFSTPAGSDNGTEAHSGSGNGGRKKPEVYV